MSADGTRLVVGAKSDAIAQANDGAAYVYRRSGTDWIFEQRLTASDATTNGYFGTSVDISQDGSTIVVGSPGLAEGYVFTRSGTTWTQQAILDTSSTFSTSYNRFIVAIDNAGTRIAIAEMLENRVTVYARSGGVWAQEYQYVASTTPYLWFGNAVAISGDGATIAVGDQSARDSNRGAVITFKRSGTTWSLFEAIPGPAGAADEDFGSSVALSDNGDVLAAAAAKTIVTGLARGALYLYRKGISTWALEATKLTPGGVLKTGETFVSGDGSLVGIDRVDGMDLYAYASAAWSAAGTAPKCTGNWGNQSDNPGSMSSDASVLTCGAVVRTEASAPDAPAAPTASAAHNVVTISWSPPSGDGGTPITGYTVNGTPGGTLCTKTTAPWSCTVTLAYETSYTFTVTATNGVGPSTPSSPSTQLRPRSEPNSPSIDTVEQLAGDKARITFTPGYGFGDPILSNTITCDSTDGGVTQVVTSSTSPATITGLSTAATYRCRGTSTNDVGQSTTSGYSPTFLASRRLTVASISGQGTVTDNSGALSCTSACAVGLIPDQTVTLTAAPAVGWTFSSWSGACSGSGTTCSTLMTQAREVAATFVLAPAPAARPQASASSTPSQATTEKPPSPTIDAVAVKNGNATLSFIGSTGTRYTITATNGKKTKAGTCATVGAKVACAIKLPPGAWGIQVTPTRNGLRGAPTRKTVKVR